MGQTGSWSRADGAAFEGWLGGLGIEHRVLDANATQALRDRWRRTYAAGFFGPANCGRISFDFETFTRGIWPALNGEAAIRAYGAQREVRYYVLPDATLDGMPAYRCASRLLPTFHGDDLIVCALDLSWTMAFTHVDGSIAGGPFFARADTKPL